MERQFIQYGCGMSAPLGWRNFDVSPTLRLQQIPVLGQVVRKRQVSFPSNVEYGDIVRGLRITPSSCRGVYCSHVLEHLALEDLRAALRHTYSYLEDEGIFRLVLPDLESLIKSYINSNDPDAAVRFIRHSGMGLEKRTRGIIPLLRAAIGNSSHLWLWDFRSLRHELEVTGFREIRRAEFHDSAEIKFKEVEDPDRWNGFLGIQCIR